MVPKYFKYYLNCFSTLLIFPPFPPIVFTGYLQSIMDYIIIVISFINCTHYLSDGPHFVQLLSVSFHALFSNLCMYTFNTMVPLRSKVMITFLFMQLNIKQKLKIRKYHLYLVNVVHYSMVIFHILYILLSFVDFNYLYL